MRTLMIGVLLVLAAGCGGDSRETSRSKPASGTSTSTASDVASRNDSYDAAPTERLTAPVTVQLHTSKGTLGIKVDPALAPIAASNFVFLVKDGFYDGIVFHRIIKDFMVQTGDPLGTGTGGPGYQLKDDPVKGSYTRGTVAMANAGPNTGGSQFFIVQGSSVQLPKDYVIFGHVAAADMGVVDAIASVPVEPNEQGEASKPTETVRIKHAMVST